MKILYIAPHLSTGGCPQFLLKKIQVLYSEHEIHCVEYSNHGGFTVQRNQVKNLLANRFYELTGDRSDLFDIIEKINPEIIHLEEMPEYFMDAKITRRLYKKDRKYKIIETSHDSSFDPANKVVFPDKIILVSEYQRQNLKSLPVPLEVCEYPVLIKPRKPREEALKLLGLNPNKKHVVHVGLFTPRKNQKEIIEYARMMQDYPIQFHFIGNQADNFKFYWEPLMKDFPANCKWWNERKDVDNFYQAADLFLFVSKDEDGNKETSPLVIREAVSFNVPTLIYNSPVYMNMYNKYNNIKYLDFNDKQANCNKILKTVNLEEIKKMHIFKSSWDEKEQKMNYSVNRPVDFPIIVSLREYKSNAVLWSAVYETFPSNCNYWMVPVSKNSRDYSKEESFSGIKLCIYKKETGEQIYEQPYFYKFANVPTITLSNSAPYYNNYSEFFVQDKYKEWFSGKQFKNAVDVGANVGVFTAYLINRRLAKKIVSVECDSDALYDLRKNYELNDNVKIIDRALSSTNDPITFYHCSQNPIVSSTLHPDKLKQHKSGVMGNIEIKVDTVTIHDLINDIGQIDLLKIDIEGGEYSIIENLSAKLFDNISNFFIECHFFEENYKEKYIALIKKLQQNGYDVKEYVSNQSDTFVGGSECIFASKKL
jgi:FkbM family methyltransferase